MKISEIFTTRMSFSFEVFPPKTDEGMQRLKEAFSHFYKFKPDFISCTYGAGGTNAGRNFEVCQILKQDNKTEVLTHFTCIGLTRDDIDDQLRNYLAIGVENILAMRGDFPPGWQGTGGDFNHADALIRHIRTKFPQFCIAAAAYPEKHLLAPSFEADIAHLRSKQDNGAEFLITQLCHDAEAFERFLWKIREAGVYIPVVVGIMPVLNKDSLLRMTLSNGCSIPAELATVIGRYGENPDDFSKAGIEFTIKQIHRYIAAGVNGIHLYTLNKWEDIETILAGAGIREAYLQDTSVGPASF